MKVKAPSLLKKIVEALSTKTNELRIRMMIFFLLHKNLDKSSLTNSLQALVSHHHQKKKNDDVFEEEEEEGDEEENKGSLLMSYNKATSMDVMVSNTHDNMNNVVQENINMSRKNQLYNYDGNDGNDDADDDDGDGDADAEKHPRVDLTNANFEESKVEMEKESQEVVVAEGEEEEGEEDIDQAADLFIQRFKKQMLLQKQRSLERQQWLLVDV
ncbi:Polyphosphate kinase 1 [Bienertia sinuspersici]